MWDTERDSRVIADLDHAISIVELRDGAAVLTYCNAAFERMSGYALAELKGLRMRVLRGPDNDPAEISRLDAALRAGRESRTTLQNLRKDGTPYWNVVRILPVLKADGTLSYFVGEHTDVTEKRRIEAGLELHDRYLSTLGELTSDGYFHRDLDGKLTFANRGYLDITGLTPQALSLDDLRQCMHPDDRPRLNQWRTDYPHGTGRVEEFRFVKPGGDTTWALVRTAPLLARDGTVRGLVGILTDLTSQKLAEQAARETAMLITLDVTAIIQTDLDQRPILWNESATRLYGWTRADATAQPSLAFLQTDDGRDRFDRAWGHLLEHGRWEGELVRRHRDGQRVTVQAKWGVVRDGLGRPTSVLCSETEGPALGDVGLKAARAQRLESIGEMASGVAHDLNNVLQPIMMTLDMLDQLIVDPKQRQWLSLAAQSAARGAELLRGVLTFARGGEETRVDTSIGAILTEAVKIMRGAFPPNISITVSHATDLRHVSADPTQMHQLVMNLAINARDAMPDGGRLSIAAENMIADSAFCRSHPDATEGPYVLLRVADTGVGMSPELLEQIFTPFFTTKGSSGGTGIGLSTVDAIIRGHGGFLRAYSEPGNGTAFTVFLPAVDVAGAAAADVVVTEEARLAELAGHGERILIVDDESMIREIALQTLERLGYRVIAVSSPTDAMNLIQGGIAVDLVLTDLMMPGASGQSLIAELRAAAPTIRVVAMSGLDRREADPSLGVPFLLKPFSSRTLLETLARQLAHPV